MKIRFIFLMTNRNEYYCFQKEFGNSQNTNFILFILIILFYFRTDQQPFS